MNINVSSTLGALEEQQDRIVMEEILTGVL